MINFKDFYIQKLNEELVSQSGTQFGSNPGGIHTDTETGKKYYVKQYKNPDQAKVEALTGKLYKAIGIKTLSPTMHGESSIKTPWNDNIESVKPKDFKKLSPKQARQLADMYHGAILTKNWDIVGLVHDNIMRHKKTGDLISIDHGGSMHFRAQGGIKPGGFDSDIKEKESLVNNDGASGDVFSHLHKHHPDAIKDSLESLKNLDMGKIHKAFKSSGLSNWEEMHSNFVKKHQKLVGSS